MDAKTEVVESKRFIQIDGGSGREKGTPLYYGKSHYVDESTWCKNVRFGACHYVDENTDT
jgi:hypothetical protein